MFVKQISVFIENKKGRLAALTKELADHGFNLKALSIADTADFGILRFISEDTDRVLQVIRDKGFTARVTDVLVVEVPDEPGGLARVVRILDEADVSVEYLYSFVLSAPGKALIMFRVSDNERALEALQSQQVRVVDEAHLRLA